MERHIAKNSEFSIASLIYPNNWSSSNTSVVIIGSNSGIATMVGAGTAQITANWSVERSYENYPCPGGGYFNISTGGETIVSESHEEATHEIDIEPSIAACGTCITTWRDTDPTPAGLTVRPNVAKIQYQSGSSYVDISGTLYVLKGTTVTFKAVPDPANATFPSNRPIWAGSSGASGTGQTKSVTFNTVSTTGSDFKTVTASSGNIRTVNVLVYELTGVFTPANNFFKRSLVRFGVEEGVALSFTASPVVTASQAGGLRWSIATTGPGIGTLSTMDDGTGNYVAPDTAKSITLTLKVLAGPSKDQERPIAITIVEPSGAFLTKFSGIKHFYDTWSAGFLGDIHITPKNVSFYNLSFYEGAAPANSWGWLLGYPQNHLQSQVAVRINSTNTVHVQDEIFTGVKAGPYGIGEWYWNIPFRVITNSGRHISLPDVRQLSTADSAGKAVISKGGASVSRVPADPTTPY